MCGIFCIFSAQANASKLLEEFSNFKTYIKKRGPDAFDVHLEENLLMAASVLWLQGDELTKQPLVSPTSVFVYNGDIFYNDRDSGDTSQFCDLVRDSERLSCDLCEIKGPFAFIYFDRVRLRLYFGRDVFGRRSLLIGKRETSFIVTSVAKRLESFRFLELPVLGVFCYDFKAQSFSIRPWPVSNQIFDKKLHELREFLEIPVEVEEPFIKHDQKLFSKPTEMCLQIFNDVNGSNLNFSLKNLCSKFLPVLKTLKTLLKASVKTRICTQPPYCRLCIKEKLHCTHALTGILFSGGIDCAILAYLTHQCTDLNRPIDLINVAFDKVRDYRTPDRLTGLSSFRELQKLCPERTWNFLEVNVTQSELNDNRDEVIADLIYPLQTVLDDSLGCALWFASRGRTDRCTSSARILLSGMGADELFGGYTKHRNALRRHGWEGLHRSLEDDWLNLPYRNLARDDRMVSDHGRQLRVPYLDENVVRFVRSLDCWQRTFPVDDVPQGLGEKVLLRCLAYVLGLKEAAVLKKRAFQFGSKIANSKENANDVSQRLL